MRLILALFMIVVLPTAAQISIIDLHPDGIETNEPCISIDPNNPATQILGSNTSLFFISENGGYQWTPKFLKPKEGFYGDPVVYIANDGNYYLCHLSKNPEKPWPNQFDRMVFEKSTDQGKTFTSTGVGFHGNKIQDKPWFCVDEGKRSKYKNRIYMSWTEFDKYGSKEPTDSSRIRFAYSNNFGDSFTDAITISDSCGDAADDDNTLEGATLATGPKGELFVVWAGKGKIWMDKSLDGGKTWGKDIIIANQNGSWNTEDVSGLLRSNSMPFVIADNKGRLYVVFGDNRNKDQDVFYLYSSDLGKTWSNPIRLHDDKLQNGKDQYMPAITLDRKRNRVYACWYDRRNSIYNSYTDLYCTNLKGIKPGKNVRVSPESFCVPGSKIFFGDYISIASVRGEIRMAYTVYDMEKMIATVNIAAFQDKVMKNRTINQKEPFLQIVQLKDTPKVYIHFYLPAHKSCTLELRRGEQTFYKLLFDPLNNPENEVLIPLDKLPPGVYKVNLTSKGKKLEKNFFIERK